VNVIDSSIIPPDDEVPAHVQLSLIIGHSPTLALAVADISVYTNGFSFSTYLFVRDSTAAALLQTWSSSWYPTGANSDFRLAIGYQDGTKFSIFRESRERHSADAVRPLVYMRGMTRDRLACNTAFVSPLPREGKVAVTSGWPSQGLSRSKSEFDASALLEARHRVIQIWESPGR
jgi:hypothetical protein